MNAELTKIDSIDAFLKAFAHLGPEWKLNSKSKSAQLVIVKDDDLNKRCSVTALAEARTGTFFGVMNYLTGAREANIAQQVARNVAEANDKADVTGKNAEIRKLLIEHFTAPA